jgi:hypothetical protein
MYSADGGENGCIAVWDIVLHTCLNRTPPSPGRILALCLAQDGQKAEYDDGDGVVNGLKTRRVPLLLSSCSDNTVSVWDASSPSSGLKCIAEIKCPPIGHVLCLTVTSMDILLLGSQDANVRCVPIGCVLDKYRRAKEEGRVEGVIKVQLEEVKEYYDDKRQVGVNECALFGVYVVFFLG